MKFWEALVTQSPPCSIPGYDDPPKELKAWVRDYYCKNQGGSSMLRHLAVIKFDRPAVESPTSETHETPRRSKILEERKMLDKLTAQLYFTRWLLETAKFEMSELEAIGFDMSVVTTNVNRFLQRIVETYRKNEAILTEKLLLTKEDKQLVTKSKIIALAEVFALCNYLHENDEASQLDSILNSL